VIAPVAVVASAAHACAAQTWAHPESEGRITRHHGHASVRVSCHRTESNHLIFDRITVAVVVPESLADPIELVAAEAKTCAPFRGIACEVDAI